ncbi:hypothetical protein [Hyphomonas sp.]|uniref:hypothetical protein n=1 Tax=Hyphomonas sp. TaxID=87 RepID=UPI003528EBE9
MNWTVRIAAFSLSCAALFVMPAQAGFTRDVAAVQCAEDSSAALIRIGKVEWVEPGPPQWDALPQSLAGDWPDAPGDETHECQMTDGRQVEMTLTIGQAFAYGMNGGTEAAWVSLWIDGHSVLSRYLVRAGYLDQSGNDVSAILVTSDTLRICDRPNILPPAQRKAEAYAELGRDPEGCFIQPLALDAQPLDPVQMAEESALGTYTVAATYSEAFCRKFIAPDERQPGKERLNFRPPMVEPLAINRLQFKSDRYRMSKAGLRMQWDEFDFDNDGQSDTVILANADSHYIDGDILLFRPGHHPDALESLAALEEFDDYRDWARQNEFQMVTGSKTQYGRDRYTHFNLFQIDGMTFVEAYPTNRSLRPSAVLYRYRTVAPFRRGSFDTVCMFQQILPND